MSDSGNSIVATAATQLGRDDSDCGGQGCYFGNGKEWCSEFVAWTYNRAGFPFTTGGQGGWLLTSTTQIIDWFTSHSSYVDRFSPDWGAFTPTPGDYVFIGRVGDPERKHSGIVESIDASGTLHTIEGNNAGRRVARYVYPAFRTNTTSNAPTETNGYVKGFGLRCGKQIRLPNGTARASSSGDDRPPANAFDGVGTTFWRNRTQQSGSQYLEMDFNGRAYTVTKISLTFGSHLPRGYQFKFRHGNLWLPSTTIAGNTERSRAHVWFSPMHDVEGVRLYGLEYSADDYFSVYDMAIQR